MGQLVSHALSDRKFRHNLNVFEFILANRLQILLDTLSDARYDASN